MDESSAEAGSRINSKMVGASGEFLVCGILAQLKWTPDLGNVDQFKGIRALRTDLVRREFGASM